LSVVAAEGNACVWIKYATVVAGREREVSAGRCLFISDISVADMD